MATKLLVISNYSDPVNPIRPEAEIFLGLTKLDFEIHIISPKDSVYGRKLEEAGCHMHDYRPKGKFDLRAIRMIRQIIRSNGIDIVHAFNSKAISCAAFAMLGSKAKLVSYRGYTGNIHWFDPTLYLTFLNPRIDYMVCLAESVREQYLKNGISKDQAVTIHKGHDASWYEIEPASLDRFNLPSDAMVCSFVANYRTTMKGVIDLIKASELLEDGVNIHYLMIGSGLDSTEVKQALKGSPRSKNFHFIGFRKNASAIVKACDISISVSRFGEATQKAMIEALYLGNPVIISDIVGNRGMVEDGKGGYIVPTKNPHAIAKALKDFYNNPDGRKTMGEAARAHITSFLSLEDSIQRYGAFYKSILN